MNPIQIIQRFFSIKIFAAILCSILLSLQTYQLLQQYLLRNTVTSIKFHRNIIGELPGLTICYDQIFSFAKLANRFTEYKQEYDNYSLFVKEFFQLNNSPFNRVLHNFTKSNKYFSDKYSEIITKKHLHHFYYFNRWTNYGDIFENLTLSQESGYEIQENKLNIHLDNTGLGNYSNGKDGYSYYFYSIAAIQSVNLFYKLKCFTIYFKQISPEMRKFINLIEVVITIPTQWFPYKEDNKLLIALHSNNYFPLHGEDFVELKQNSFNFINISTIQNYQLFNYDNCQEYNENKYKTRSDCILTCYQNSAKPECYHKFSELAKLFLLKKYLPSWNENIKCNRSIKNYKILKKLC